MGLDIGGEDYITKSFKLGVLMSRINALLRRAKDFGAADSEVFYSRPYSFLIISSSVCHAGLALMVSSMTWLDFSMASLFISVSA